MIHHTRLIAFRGVLDDEIMDNNTEFWKTYRGTGKRGLGTGVHGAGKRLYDDSQEPAWPT